MYQLIKVPSFLSFLPTFHYLVFLNFRLLCVGLLVFISKKVRNSAGQANIYNRKNEVFCSVIVVAILKASETGVLVAGIAFGTQTKHKSNYCVYLFC